uniref:Uncharacterized protein n=1 Tax=Romanomermis culicivorax TaxID=13658 RepID=A0A915JI55_ROMCU
MIQESYSRLDVNNKAIPEGSMKFDDGILKPSKLLFEGGLDPVLRGFMNMAVKRPQRLTTALTERMFGTTDLAAINIQRGKVFFITSEVWSDRNFGSSELNGRKISALEPCVVYLLELYPNVYIPYLS